MDKKIPMRRCCGCMNSFDKNNLIRVVMTAEGDFVIDTSGKINGRGAYICNNVECMRKCIKNHGLERSFKTNLPKEIYDNLLKEMENLNA